MLGVLARLAALAILAASAGLTLVTSHLDKTGPFVLFDLGRCAGSRDGRPRLSDLRGRVRDLSRRPPHRSG